MPSTPRISLVDAVATAIDQMDWLTPTDRAVAEVARRYAAEIEAASEGLEAVETARVMKLLAPELVAVLRDLGGTPGQRKAIGVEHKVRGKLAELREAAAGEGDPSGLDPADPEADPGDE